MDYLKVSANSSPNSVAGAIAGSIRENGQAQVQAVGAGAVNQAVKAVAIARTFFADTGLDIVLVPEFIEIELDGETRTALKFTVEPR